MPVVFHIVLLIAKVGECGLGCAVGRSGFSPITALGGGADVSRGRRLTD